MRHLIRKSAKLTLLIVFSVTACTADRAIDDINMGLSKTSVFDDPTPMVSQYSMIEPGEQDRMPRAYSTLPPQIGHTVDEYLPITMEENACIDCHDRRKQLLRKGWEWKVGRKLPMPDDHYGTFKQKGGSEDIAGSRYNCMQCHVPLSDAKPLVLNTFK